jgi:uncharacterized protein (TIGR02246 family)
MAASRSNSEEAGVKRILGASIQRFVVDLKRGDFEALTAQYAEDAVLLPQNAGILRGRAAIANFFRTWMTSTTIQEIEILTENIRVVGETAYEVGTYRMVFQDVGSPPARDEGKFLVVRERGPDGKWLISYDMSGSNQKRVGAR